jgi:hypothetical protein
MTCDFEIIRDSKLCVHVHNDCVCTWLYNYCRCTHEQACGKSTSANGVLVYPDMHVCVHIRVGIRV